MTIQQINIGNVVNDGLGDDLRTAFQKVNANFADLSSSLTVTASNAAGNAGQGIFKEKVGNNLSFRNLTAGIGIELSGFTDAVRITNTNPYSFTRIDTDAGAISAVNYPQITIQGGDNISVTATNQVITVDTVLDIDTLFGNFDFGPITVNYQNVLQLSLAAANIDFGTVPNPGNFYIDLGEI
jgi:hypothetical protein